MLPIVAREQDRRMRRGGSCGVSPDGDLGGKHYYSAVIPAAAVMSLKLTTSAFIIASICFGPR